MSKSSTKTLGVAETSLIIQSKIEDFTPLQVLNRDKLVEEGYSLLVANEFVEIFSKVSLEFKADVTAWLDKNVITDESIRKRFIEGTLDGLKDSLLDQLSE